MRLGHALLGTARGAWLSIGGVRLKPRTAPRRRPAALSLTALEPRENPAIPAGLGGVPLLIANNPPSVWSSPVVYDETHTITHDEAMSVTVDQSGTGSAGTFTI